MMRRRKSFLANCAASRSLRIDVWRPFRGSDHRSSGLLFLGKGREIGWGKV